jgi:hypothetical protein
MVSLKNSDKDKGSARQLQALGVWLQWADRSPFRFRISFVSDAIIENKKPLFIKSMGKVERCEICHKSDELDSARSYCRRCDYINVYVKDDMSRKTLDKRWRTILALVFVICLCRPPVMALDDSDKTTKGAGSEKSAIDLSELVRRLEQAEAEVNSARDAARAAQLRAIDLEKKVDEMQERLTKASRELERVNGKSVTSGDSVAGTGSQEQKEKPVQQEQQEEVADNGNSASKADALEMLNERILQLEEQKDLDKARLAEFGQTRVESGEKFYVKLFGTLLFNSYYNTAGTFDAPTGLYLFSENNRQLENGSNFGATIRQTILGLAFKAPTIGRWKLSGDLQLDFFGGNPPVYNGRAFSPLRLRIARARLQHLDPEGNPGRLAVVLGQDDPIISPLNPTSLAQVGFPAFAESGNLWSWTPQAKVIYNLISKKRERLSFEGGILAPFSGAIASEFQFETRPDAGERGRMPAFEARLSYQRGDLLGAPTNSYLIFDPQPFQVGLGVHYARLMPIQGLNVDSTIVTGDYVIPLGSRMTLSGELFWGRAVSGLGGGIVQGIALRLDRDPTARGIRSRGGWAQLQMRLAPKVAVNVGYGTDDPYNEDLIGTRFEMAGGTSRAANRSVSANILYRFRSNFIMSAEYRFMQTLFTEATIRHNNHINIGFGYLF